MAFAGCLPVVATVPASADHWRQQAAMADDSAASAARSVMTDIGHYLVHGLGELWACILLDDPAPRRSQLLVRRHQSQGGAADHENGGGRILCLQVGSHCVQKLFEDLGIEVMHALAR